MFTPLEKQLLSGQRLSFHCFFIRRENLIKLSLCGFCTCFQGIDLRSGILQQQKPFMQSPQPFHQLQMLSPRHQQQLLLAQQNLTSPSSIDENRRFRMMLNSHNVALGKDGLLNSVGDMVPNIGSSLQAGGPLSPDVILKAPSLLFS